MGFGSPASGFGKEESTADSQLPTADRRGKFGSAGVKKEPQASRLEEGSRDEKADSRLQTAEKKSEVLE